MKLFYYCSSRSCRKINSLKVQSDNRLDLKEEIGEQINERCKHCGSFTKRHINRLHSEPNYFLIIGGVGLAVIFTIVFWDLGFVTTLCGSLPIAIWMNENKKASAFNKVMLK